MDCKNRVGWIDMVKGLGIILMVIGHSGAPELLEKFIYGFHMPLFFIASGYLWNKKWENRSLKELIYKRVFDYIVPYFILCFVNLLLNLIMDIHNLVLDGLLPWLGRTVLSIIYSYGRSGYMPNCTPLWFLPCIFVCNIYMWFLVKIKKKYVRYMLCLLGIGVEYVLMKCSVVQMPWHIEVSLLGVAFMQIGYVMKEREWLLKSKFLFPFSVLGGLLFLLNGRVEINENQVGNMFLFFVVAISLSYIVFYICFIVKESRILVWFGQNTIFIMAFNYFFNTITTVIWIRIPIVNKLEYYWWIKSIVVILCCCVMIVIWKQIKRVCKCEPWR